MALRRSGSTRRPRTIGRGGGGGSTQYAGGSTSGRQSLEEYIARLEASHRLQVERSAITGAASESRTTASGNAAMARWIAQQQVTLQNKRDQEALDRIGKGDAAYGMLYAKRRAAEADDDDDRTYWNDIYDRAREKAEDDHIAGLVKSGDMEARDILPILQQRRDRQQVGSPGYLALSKQIGEVNNAIKADAFNKEAAAAQAKYVATGDRKALIGDLLGLYARAKEGTARTALQTRISGLQKELETEAEVKRNAAVTSKVAAYYADRTATPSSAVLWALAEGVKNAKSPAEAQRFIALAQSITSRERTLQQDAVRAAGGAGRGGSGGSGTTATKNALDKELEDERANMKDISQTIQDEVLDKGLIPTPEQWAIFWSAGDQLKAGLEAGRAAGGLTTAAMKTLTDQLRDIDHSESTGRLAMKQKAGKNVVKMTEQLKKEVASAMNAVPDNEGAAAKLTAAAPLIAQLRDLTNTPWTQGDKVQTDAIANDLEAALKPARDTVEKASIAFARGSESPAAMRTKYEAFAGAYENIHGSGTAPPFEAWLEGMSITNDRERGKFLNMIETKPDGTEVLRNTVQPDDKRAFDAIVASVQKAQDAALANARVGAALVAGKRADAFSRFDINEVLMGAPDMETRRAKVLAGRSPALDLQPESPPEERTYTGKGSPGTDPRMGGGSGTVLNLMNTLFSDNQPDPTGDTTGYTQATLDPGMMDAGAVSYAPDVAPEPGYGGGTPFDGPRLVADDWGRQTEENPGWMSLAGSPSESSAYDFLDSTMDLSSFLSPEPVLPDEVEEFPFLDAPSGEDLFPDYSMPDLPGDSADAGERARDARVADDEEEAARATRADGDASIEA